MTNAKAGAGRFRVVITDLWTDELTPEHQVLDGLARIDALDAHGEAELAGQVEDADAMIVNHQVTITAPTLDRLKQCKLIVRSGVGYDNIDAEYAGQQGIAVARVPDYGTEEVADSAMALALAQLRAVGQLNSRMRGGQDAWSYTHMMPLNRLRGETFGVVGMGAIGCAVARRAQAFGMSVVGLDPYLRAGFDKAVGIERVQQLSELLSRSYVVSLHCGLSEETFHLIDEEALGMMRRGSFLVNTARGGLVDTAAIPPAIASGQLAGAGFDVIEGEPPSDGDPLVVAWRDPEHPAHHRVIINPHASFYSEQSMHDLRTQSAKACRAALLGQPVRHVVNKVSQKI